MWRETYQRNKTGILNTEVYQEPDCRHKLQHVITFYVTFKQRNGKLLEIYKKSYTCCYSQVIKGIIDFEFIINMLTHQFKKPEISLVPQYFQFLSFSCTCSHKHKQNVCYVQNWTIQAWLYANNLDALNDYDVIYVCSSCTPLLRASKFINL